MSSRRRRPACAGSDEEEDDETIERVGVAVYFYADVTLRNVRKMLRLVEKASEAALKRSLWGEEARVLLYIHSGGGDLYAAMTALDHIESSPVPVWTVADGFVASAATLIAIGGSRRFAMPHACLLVHAMSTSIEGKFQSLLEETKNAKTVMRIMSQTYLARTTLGAAAVEKMLKKESLLTFEEAVKHGFVEGSLCGATDPSRARKHARFE